MNGADIGTLHEWQAFYALLVLGIPAAIYIAVYWLKKMHGRWSN